MLLLLSPIGNTHTDEADGSRDEGDCRKIGRKLIILKKKKWKNKLVHTARLIDTSVYKPKWCDKVGVVSEL